MKDWLGAEPALGILVMLVCLPIVGVLAFIVVGGAIEHPFWFLLFWVIYAGALVSRFLFKRLGRKLSVRVERALWLAVWVGLFGWSLVPPVIAWVVEGRPGPTISNIAALLVGLILLRHGERQIDKTDYHHR